jgi:hypothetical protein
LRSVAKSAAVRGSRFVIAHGSVRWSPPTMPPFCAQSSRSATWVAGVIRYSTFQLAMRTLVAPSFHAPAPGSSSTTSSVFSPAYFCSSLP